MKKIILKIGGMSCSACSSSLEKYLNKQNGIINASVNLVLSSALIEYDDNLTLSDLELFVKEAGYESLGIYDENNDNVNKNNEKIKLFIFGILSIVILYISMSSMLKLPSIYYLDMIKYPTYYSISLFTITILFLIYGFDIFKSGIKNLVHKSPNMDTLVTIGVFSSFIYSLFNMIMVLFGYNQYVENLYFESSSIIIFFVKFGRYIDFKSKEKTKEAIKELVQITPNKAIIKTQDGEKEISIDEVKKNDILIAKPGFKIAVDGVITKGETHLDEAFLTGESIPSKKYKGDKVIAGSINIDNYIEYKAYKIGKDSTISEIVRLVLEATNTKAPISRLADKISSYFVPSIIIIAIITFIFYLLFGYELSEALISFITVLLVACPCALGLATPLAIVIGEGLCAKNGILVKSSEILENAYKVDTIVFDKTGTLTFGNLKISRIFNYSTYSNNKLIELVSSLEIKVGHPISKAFINYVKENNLKTTNVEKFSNIDGIGLTGVVNKKNLYVGSSKIFDLLRLKNEHLDDEQILLNDGNSIVYIIENKKVIGLIGVKDIVRDNAKNIVNELTNLNKEIIMLTGDNKKTADIVSESIGIRNVIASVLPKEKTEVIRNLIQNGKNVMMVGDGINDAPSLVTANIGVSINSASNIATDSSDVILMHDDLEKILDLISISKKTIKIIKQNLFWAFFYNICMIPIAIGLFKPYGIYINPMISGFAMTFSSLTVVFNALRLKRWRNNMFNKKERKIIKVEGMKCDHCAKKVEEALLLIPGVLKVKINLNKKEVIITSNKDIDDSIIKQSIEKLDYKVIEN